MRLHRAAVIAFFGLASSALAAPPDINISSVRFGEHIMGPKVSADDMKGRVVLVERWGVN